MAHEGTESGTVETTEEAFIYRVFQFTDQSVSSIMMPRTEIVAVEVNTPLADVVETFMSSGYTRLPLYEGTLDNVIGVLYAKDLLRARSQEQKETLDLRAIARPPFFISEFQHVDEIHNVERGSLRCSRQAFVPLCRAASRRPGQARPHRSRRALSAWRPDHTSRKFA